jgi:diguanylate cyclase (GGDEF)-like protein
MRTAISNRLVTAVASRLAVLGLAVVLLSMAALSLVAAFEGRQAGDRLHRAALETDVRLEANRALAEVNIVIDAYDANPSPAGIERLKDADRAMRNAVQRLRTDGSAADREISYDVEARLNALNQKGHSWVAALQAGARDLADQIEDEELDPLLDGLYESLHPSGPRAATRFRAEVDRFRASEALVRRSIYAAVPAGLLLLLLCAAILRAYRRAELARSRHDAATDPLTGLWNRRRMAVDLEAALTADSARLLVLFDLDGFKRYNDTFGHPAGDALLTRLAARLAQTVGTRGRAYRMGGDEFCALLDPGHEPAAGVVAELEAALSEPGEGVGVSSGCVVLPHDAARADAAIALADHRLYEHKRRVYGPDDSPRAWRASGRTNQSDTISKKTAPE